MPAGSQAGAQAHPRQTVRGRCRDLSRVRHARGNERIPLFGPSAGRAGRRRDRGGAGMHLPADWLPGGGLEPVD
eukprot:2859514-Alexandrium_andersonii.AAC.1